MLIIYNNAKSLIIDPTMFHIEHEKIVAPYCESKYIILSSFVFLVPAYSGIIHNVHIILPTISSLAFICSINYWRDARYCWRRSCDMIIARITFASYFFIGLYYTLLNAYVPMMFLWFISVYSILHFYYMSCNNPKIWYKYHMMFHCSVLFAKMFTIKSILNYRLQRLKQEL